MIVRRSPVGPVSAAEALGERARRRRCPSAAGRPSSRAAASLHEVEAARHALAAVDEQRERRRHALVADEIDRLRHAVFLDDEVGRAQAAHEPALAVVDPGLEQHARHLRDLGNLEGLEDDLVPALAAFAVVDLDRQLPPLERVLVGPLHRIRRPIVVGLEERAVDIEADGVERGAGGLLDLSDDANRADAAGAAERRGDANGQVGIGTARSGGGGRQGQDADGEGREPAPGHAKHSGTVNNLRADIRSRAQTTRRDRGRARLRTRARRPRSSPRPRAACRACCARPPIGRVKDGPGAVRHAELRVSPVAPDAGPGVVRGGVLRIQPRRGAQMVERRVQDLEAPVLVRHGPVVRGRRRPEPAAAGQPQAPGPAPRPSRPWLLEQAGGVGRACIEHPSTRQHEHRDDASRSTGSRALPSCCPACTCCASNPVLRDRVPRNPCCPRSTLRCAGGCAAAPCKPRPTPRRPRAG